MTRHAPDPSTPSTASGRLTLYSKPGCHLCDEMKAVIERVAARMTLDVETVDISNDAELDARYGLEIPVLLIDGRKAAKFRLTERELEEKLRRVTAMGER